MLRPSSLAADSTFADPADGLGHLVEDLLPQLRMAHLATPEHDRDLDLVALTEEPDNLPGLGVEVTRADLRPVLHLLDARTGGLAPRLLGPLGRVVLEAVVVHDPADRRVGLGGHLDQVEIQLAGDAEGFGQRLIRAACRRDRSGGLPERGSDRWSGARSGRAQGLCGITPRNLALELTRKGAGVGRKQRPPLGGRSTRTHPLGTICPWRWPGGGARPRFPVFGFQHRVAQ